ncbi:MAG: hypothetical protein J6P87_08120 [Lachnospiraceae bacterium]|nr:hypothetical protein [Lachnospiraceae bacterium]
MRKKRFGLVVNLIVIILVPVLVLGMMLPSLSGVDREVSLEEREQLENAIRRAAVACYAAEGVYPPDIEYIGEHYGVRIHDDRFIISYEVFAENIMPGIRVMEKYN